jgi:hypothetical protein
MLVLEMIGVAHFFKKCNLCQKPVGVAHFIRKVQLILKPDPININKIK